MRNSTPDVIAQKDQAPRIEAGVTMESDSHFFLASDGDVASGVFIATTRDFSVGQRIRVELALHGYVLVFRGTVRWRHSAGVGVGFDDMSGAAKRVIESFCARRRRPIPYDEEGRRLTNE